MHKEWFNHIKHRGELAEDDSFLRGNLVSVFVTLAFGSGVDVIQYLKHFPDFCARRRQIGVITIRTAVNNAS